MLGLVQTKLPAYGTSHISIILTPSVALAVNQLWFVNFYVFSINSQSNFYGVCSPINEWKYMVRYGKTVSRIGHDFQTFQFIRAYLPAFDCSFLFLLPSKLLQLSSNCQQLYQVLESVTTPKLFLNNLLHLSTRQCWQ